MFIVFHLSEKNTQRKNCKLILFLIAMFFFCRCYLIYLFFLILLLALFLSSFYLSFFCFSIKRVTTLNGFNLRKFFFVLIFRFCAQLVLTWNWWCCDCICCLCLLSCVFVNLLMFYWFLYFSPEKGYIYF